MVDNSYLGVIIFSGVKLYLPSPTYQAQGLVGEPINQIEEVVMSGHSGRYRGGVVNGTPRSKGNAKTPEHVLFATLLKFSEKLGDDVIHAKIRVNQLGGEHITAEERGAAGWAFITSRNRHLCGEHFVRMIEEIAKSGG